MQTIHLYFKQIISLPILFLFLNNQIIIPSYILKIKLILKKLLFSKKILSVVSEEKIKFYLKKKKKKLIEYITKNFSKN